MKRYFLLFFLFLKEFIISSTIKILEEKSTSFEKEHDFHNNNAIKFPDFYLQKIFHKYLYNSNNTDYSFYGLGYLNYQEEIDHKRAFYLSNTDLIEDFSLDNVLIGNEKFLSSLGNLGNNNLGENNEIANKVKIKILLLINFLFLS